jgi:hypothetical protein
MKLKLLLPTAVLMLLFLSSCGVITKARYGNGFKLNIESNLFARKDQTENKTITTKKKRIKSSLKTHSDTAVYSPVTSIASAEPIPPPAFNAPSINSELNLSATKKSSLKKVRELVRKQVAKITKPIEPKRTLEPNTEIAAWLFYGAIVLNAALVYSSLAIPGFIFTLLGIASLVGVILAFVGLRKIKLSGNTYRGYGIALSIIILFLLSLIYFVAVLALLFLLFP